VNDTLRGEYRQEWSCVARRSKAPSELSGEAVGSHEYPVRLAVPEF
jgi:hypothetical protein